MELREYSIELQKGTEIITLDFESAVAAVSAADAIYDAAKKSGESVSVMIYPTGKRP